MVLDCRMRKRWLVWMHLLVYTLANVYPMYLRFVRNRSWACAAVLKSKCESGPVPNYLVEVNKYVTSVCTHLPKRLSNRITSSSSKSLYPNIDPIPTGRVSKAMALAQRHCSDMTALLAHSSPSNHLNIKNYLRCTRVAARWTPSGLAKALVAQYQVGYWTRSVDGWY